MPRTPTLAPPITTFTPNNETMSMPDLTRTNDTLKEIKEESVESPGRVKTASEKDDASSVLSTSSRSMRLIPSLRRRVTDNTASAAAGGKQHRRDESITSSPRSAMVSPYSAGGRARRTSEVQSEDDQASLGPGLGLEITKDRTGSWGIGDEVVMGLE